jgi:hypothetical protein
VPGRWAGRWPGLGGDDANIARMTYGAKARLCPPNDLLLIAPR